MKFLFLHGFWGSSADWEPLVSSFRSRWPEADFYCPNIEAGGSQDMYVWARSFLNSKKCPEPPFHVFGYSQGGRLALHLLDALSLDFPGQFFLFGAHLGVMNESEIQVRKQWEKDWTEKMERMDLNELERAWSAQPVFANCPSRVFPRVSLVELKKQLLAWSPTRHRFENKIEDLSARCVFIAGDQDQKYLKLFETWKNQGLVGSYDLVPGHGHRFPLEAPEELAHLVASKWGSTF